MRFGYAIAAAAALWVQPAIAAVLTFEGQAGTIYQPLVTDGFIIEHPGFATNPSGIPNPSTYYHFHETSQIGGTYGNGTGVLHVDTYWPSIYLSAVGGGEFTLASFDIAAFTSYSKTYTVNGYSGGISGTLVGSLSGPLGQFATVTGFAAPVDLVTFYASDQGSESGFLLDNVVVNAFGGAVPEPSTWAMMLIGFGAIGGGMRRKRSGLQFTPVAET